MNADMFIPFDPEALDNDNQVTLPADDCNNNENNSWNNQCINDEDLIDVMRNNWSTSVMITVGVLCGFLCLLTIAGNMLVLLSFVSERRLQTYSNYYIVNLAICDFFTGLFTMPMYSTYWIIGYWPFGPAMCTFFLYYKCIFTHASFLTVSVISIDRYRSLAYPIKHLKERNIRHAKKCLAPTYIIPSLMWVFPLCIYPYIAPHYKDRDTSNQCNLFYTSPLAVLIMTSCISWIPLTITAVMYCKVYGIIRQHNNRRQKRKTVCSTVSTLALTEKETFGKTDGVIHTPVNRKKGKYPTKINTELRNTKHPIYKRSTRRLHRTFASCMDGFNLAHHVKRENARATRTLTFTYITMVVSALPWTIAAMIVSLCPDDCITMKTVEVSIHLLIINLKAPPKERDCQKSEYKNGYIHKRFV